MGGHPWVYENDILEFPETEPENGTLADVVSPKGAYLGTGFVSLKSKIRVRLISRNANDTFDASFWRRRVEYAWAYRKTVLEPADLSACRVIFGEADQFPGLTVDQITQCGVHHNQFMDSGTSAKTFVITGGAALRMVQRDGTRIGNPQQAFFFVSGRRGLAAIGTQRANQSLRHHARQTWKRAGKAPRPYPANA